MDVTLAFVNDPLGLPYPSIDSPDQIRHEYIDLRETPEKIDELPELKDLPAFKEAIRSLNAPTSLFRTLGCEKHFSDYGSQRQLGAYIDLAYAEWENNSDLFQFYILIGEFARSCRDVDLPSAQIRFELFKYEFHETGKQGWKATIKIGAFGPDDAAATATWTQALNLLVNFVSGIRQRD